ATRENVAFEARDTDIDLAEVRSRIKGGVERTAEADLRAAAALFRSDFLEGLDLDNCPGFQSWCVAERETVRRQHRQILTALVERLQAQPEEAVPFARLIVEIDPYDETARVNLIRLLATVGHREEAERRYGEGESLRRDAGSKPSAALRSVLEVL